MMVRVVGYLRDMARLALLAWCFVGFAGGWLPSWAQQSSADPLVQRAEQALSAGEPRIAVNLLEQAVRIDPQNALAHFFLGKALLGVTPSDRSGARLHFQRSADLSPTGDAGIESLVELGRLNELEKRLSDEAKARASEADAAERRAAADRIARDQNAKIAEQKEEARKIILAQDSKFVQRKDQAKKYGLLAALDNSINTLRSTVEFELKKWKNKWLCNKNKYSPYVFAYHFNYDINDNLVSVNEIAYQGPSKFAGSGSEYKDLTFGIVQADGIYSDGRVVEPGWIAYGIVLDSADIDRLSIGINLILTSINGGPVDPFVDTIYKEGGRFNNHYQTRPNFSELSVGDCQDILGFVPSQ